MLVEYQCRSKDEAFAVQTTNGSFHSAVAAIELIRSRAENCPDWSFLKGKRVLDLGCGSRLARKDEVPRVPHFCLICAANRADVTGVDLFEASPEDAVRYTHIEANIAAFALRKNVSQIPGISGSFDIVHTSAFTGYPPSPALVETLEKLGMLDVYWFETVLLCQAEKIISPGGVFLQETRLYQKGTNDSFQRLF